MSEQNNGQAKTDYASVPNVSSDDQPKVHQLSDEELDRIAGGAKLTEQVRKVGG